MSWKEQVRITKIPLMVVYLYFHQIKVQRKLIRKKQRRTMEPLRKVPQKKRSLRETPHHRRVSMESQLHQVVSPLWCPTARQTRFRKLGRQLLRPLQNHLYPLALVQSPPHRRTNQTLELIKGLVLVKAWRKQKAGVHRQRSSAQAVLEIHGNSTRCVPFDNKHKVYFWFY